MTKETLQPLRHGWGGDKKKRARVLKQREENIIDQGIFPEKYSDTATPLDMDLLRMLQRPRE